MTITNYLYCEDEIIGEIVDDVSYDYLTDALGSVTHLVDQGGVVVKNTRYKPFGEVLSNAGSVKDPFYRWVGSRGYRATTLATASHYVRARHYDQRTGVWTSLDPIWPTELAYNYCLNRVTFYIDPLGLQVIIPAPVPITTPPAGFPMGGSGSGGPGYGAPGGRVTGNSGGQGVSTPPWSGGGTDIDGPPNPGSTPSPVQPKCSVVVIPNDPNRKHSIGDRWILYRQSDFFDYRDCVENNKRIHPKNHGLPGEGCDGAPCPRPPFCKAWVDDFLKECLQRRNIQLYCDKISPPLWVPNPNNHLLELCKGLDKLLACSPQCYEGHPNRVIIDIIKQKCKGVKR